MNILIAVTGSISLILNQRVVSSLKKDEISTNYKKAYTLYESGKYDDAFNLLQGSKVN
ncbi:MAG: hypothetical protein IPJ43_11150 [Saprospiraceae bacterium]|nr:hypothetical protein [Saprospiraceae bacterium]